jgi:hypothetical protein
MRSDNEEEEEARIVIEVSTPKPTKTTCFSFQILQCGNSELHGGKAVIYTFMPHCHWDSMKYPIMFSSTLDG